MTVSFEIPDGALHALASDQQRAVSEVRMAAAAKLFELGRLSSGAAAELAGLSRVEFLERLADFGVSALSQTEEELARDAARA